MKVLNPTVTVVVCSHMKPTHLPGALDSILEQTRQDIQIIVIDSGVWTRDYCEMYEIHQRYSALAKVEWYSLGEPPNLIERKCPYAYSYNQVINLGLIRGEYVCFFTDDDRYYPTYIEKMVKCLELPEARSTPPKGLYTRWAAFCAEDRVRIEPDGTETQLPGLPADAPRHGESFLDQVDLLQMMIRTKVLRHLGSTSDPWFPENVYPGQCRHADGLFMNKVGLIVDQVHNVPEALVQHRFTPESTYN